MSQKFLQPFCSDSDIETVTQRIEAAGTDIAPNYADWRDLGFALADALGESGRSYYGSPAKVCVCKMSVES
jgi:hypothetical protein